MYLGLQYTHVNLCELLKELLSLSIGSLNHIYTLTVLSSLVDICLVWWKLLAFLSSSADFIGTFELTLATLCLYDVHES